ncbi:MAG: glycosyltransferase family 4 protein [Gemmatimonadaceae bacterium]|nr:glycosyltransferase family 4 protein [Gemmatimonadaceae bacterium]
MRVLFVTHNVPRFDGDAAGSFVLRLAVALQDAGARVEIIAPGTAGLAARDTIEGVIIHRVRYAPDADMTLAYTGTMVEQVRRSWSARRALLGLLRALRQAARTAIAQATQAGDAFDVIHAHWWFPAGLALWRGLPRPSNVHPMPARVLTMHGSDVRLARTIAPARWLMRTVLREYPVRTAVSTWLAQTVQSMTDNRRVHVAPMPVDIRHFALPVTDARSGVLFVGRLNAQKGIADLLSSLAQPALQSTTLDVVGDGPDREVLAAQSVASGIANRIRWHGVLSQADLVPLYQRAAVVAMPSREEGLGLVAVEAQLCGAPVVAYASGGLVDVVRPEAGGTLVPVGDTAALASAIAALVRDPGAAATRGRRAHADILARFSPASVADQYLQYYRDAIAASPATAIRRNA